MVRLPHVAERYPQRALRRPAAAHRAGALPRLSARDHPDGRAARRARQEAARPDAARDQAHPPRARHHHRLRHARPGRGDDDVGPHLPDERRRDRAARHAAGALLPPRTLFVADFLGESNLLRGHRARQSTATDVEVVLGDGATRVTRDGARCRCRRGEPVRVMVRPQNIARRRRAAPAHACAASSSTSMITGSLTKLYVAVAASAGEAPTRRSRIRPRRRRGRTPIGSERRVARGRPAMPSPCRRQAMSRSRRSARARRWLNAGAARRAAGAAVRRCCWSIRSASCCCSAIYSDGALHAGASTASCSPRRSTST